MRKEVSDFWIEVPVICNGFYQHTKKRNSLDWIHIVFCIDIYSQCPSLIPIQTYESFLMIFDGRRGFPVEISANRWGSWNYLMGINKLIPGDSGKSMELSNKSLILHHFSDIDIIAASLFVCVVYVSVY